MGQLVADHGPELAVVEDLGDAGGHGDRGVARVAAGRERVGLHGRADVEPRHGLVRGRRELADHLVKRGELGLAHGTGPHGPQGDLVGPEVGRGVHAQRDEDGDDEAGATAEPVADPEDHRGEQTQQDSGLEAVVMPVHSFFTPSGGGPVNPPRLPSTIHAGLRVT